jgi:hypothetical protein
MYIFLQYDNIDSIKSVAHHPKLLLYSLFINDIKLQYWNNQQKDTMKSVIKFYNNVCEIMSIKTAIDITVTVHKINCVHFKKFVLLFLYSSQNNCHFSYIYWILWNNLFNLSI